MRGEFCRLLGIYGHHRCAHSVVFIVRSAIRTRVLVHPKAVRHSVTRIEAIGWSVEITHVCTSIANPSGNTTTSWCSLRSIKACMNFE